MNGFGMVSCGTCRNGVRNPVNPSGLMKCEKERAQGQFFERYTWMPHKDTHHGFWVGLPLWPNALRICRDHQPIEENNERERAD